MEVVSQTSSYLKMCSASTVDRRASALSLSIPHSRPPSPARRPTLAQREPHRAHPACTARRLLLSPPPFPLRPAQPLPLLL